MNFRLQIWALIALLVYFFIIFILLKRKRLSLRYTLLWIFSGMILFILVCFPKVLELGAEVFGVMTPINLLFIGMIGCILMILMSLTVIISKLNESKKTLIQTVAILEKRIRELEKYMLSDQK